MARTRKVPLKSSTSGRVRRLVAPRAGQPGEPLTRFTFPVIPKPVFPKAKIRTLIKRDVAKGVTMPEANNMTDTPGVVTGGTGGYKGATVMHQQPLVPPSPAKNLRVVAPPSPTNKGGVRNPYNMRNKVGRSIGKTTRYSGKRMK